MNGPPTPPTSADELPPVAISDPAVPPAAPVAAVAAPTAGDSSLIPYTGVFPAIASAAVSGDTAQVIALAERADLDVYRDDHPSRLLITAPLVLAYLVVNDLPPARYALSRLPDTFNAIPLAQAVFNLLCAVSERKYEHVYPRADAVLEITTSLESSDAAFARVLQVLTTAFLDAFRERTLALLARAYTSIALPLAGTYLGLTRDALLTVTEARRWMYDASAQVLTPAPAPSQTRARLNGFASAPSTLETFGIIADSVTSLEA